MDRIEADLEKDTKVVKLPVALRDSWIPHAKLYYALKQMDKIDQVHNLIFEEIHLEDNRLNTEQQMIDFLGKHGIDTDKFIEKYKRTSLSLQISKVKIVNFKILQFNLTCAVNTQSILIFLIEFKPDRPITFKSFKVLFCPLNRACFWIYC